VKCYGILPVVQYINPSDQAHTVYENKVTFHYRISYCYVDSGWSKDSSI